MLASPEKLNRFFLQFGLRELAVIMALVSVTVCYFYSPILSGVRPTGRELDLAIFGRGYFQVSDYMSGETYYTRHGRLSIDSTGGVFVGNASDGWRLEPQITIPIGQTKISIDKHGSFSVANQSNTESTIGSIQLAIFSNDEGLQQITPGIYASTDVSGPPCPSTPGVAGAGYLQQGWLEPSNSWQTAAPFLVVGLFAVILIYTIFEIRSLRNRLDVVISHLPEHR